MLSSSLSTQITFQSHARPEQRKFRVIYTLISSCINVFNKWRFSFKGTLGFRMAKERRLLNVSGVVAVGRCCRSLAWKFRVPGRLLKMKRSTRITGVSERFQAVPTMNHLRSVGLIRDRNVFMKETLTTDKKRDFIFLLNPNGQLPLHLTDSVGLSSGKRFVHKNRAKSFVYFNKKK